MVNLACRTTSLKTFYRVRPNSITEIRDIALSFFYVHAIRSHNFGLSRVGKNETLFTYTVAKWYLV